MRDATPFRLASESIRNCPEITTCCPASRPLRISVCPLDSMPISTSTGANLPSPWATITTLRLPVVITASLGTWRISMRDIGLNVTLANMPGTRAPAGLASSTRTFSVRVAGLTSGRMAVTLPLKVVPASAGARASTALPGRTCAARLSGTSALTQTVERPLMRNSGVPAATVMPSRAPSSATTPPIGAVSVNRGCTLPLAATDWICASVMPTRRMRWRAPSMSAPAPVMRATDRYSSCAATQSGTYSSASGWPCLTGSNGARTNSRSMNPPLRAWMTATSRSLYATVPTASTVVASALRVTAAVRTPRFCCMRALMATLPSSAPASA